MTPSESPTADGPYGAPVGDDEELYRCITDPRWWVEEEDRPSSFAFKYPCFSVDVASISGSPEATLVRFRPGTGLVVFPCRVAKQLGCDVHLEADDRYPDNRAHAHVYMPKASARRKTAARKLVDASRVLRRPSFRSDQAPASSDP
jgi:hypothetical protein